MKLTHQHHAMMPPHPVHPQAGGGPYPNLTGGMSGAVLPGRDCPGGGLSSGPRRVPLLSVSERVSQYAARRLSVGLRVLGAGGPAVPSRVPVLPAEGRLRGAGASAGPGKCGSDACRGSSGRSGGGHVMGTINLMPG